MKKLSKFVSLVLSLALCLGMASPAFAASFSELQDAIDGKEGVILENGHTGYAAQTDEDGKVTGYGIEAWNGTRTETMYDENGDVVETKEVDTRNVQLNEDVNYSEDDTSGIRIGNGLYGETHAKDVTIDLNGHDIDLNPDAVLNTNDGKFYKAEKDAEGKKVARDEVADDSALNTGSVIRLSPNDKDDLHLTINDSSEDQSGTITGGNKLSNQYGGDGGNGGGIYNAGSVTLNGGSITGNRAKLGGGISSGTFIMNGGSVSGNQATGNGGGVTAGIMVMNDGKISGNVSSSSGGGVMVNSGNRFIMKNGEISGNLAQRGGGVTVNTANGEFTMSGGSISGNSADIGAGVNAVNSNFEMKGGSIAGNYGAAVSIKSNYGNSCQMIKTGGSLSGDIISFTDKNGIGTNKFSIAGITYLITATNSEDAPEKQIITIAIQDSEGKQIGEKAVTSLLDIGTVFELNTTDPSNPRIELQEGSIDKDITNTNGFGGYVDSTGFHPYQCCEVSTPVEDPAVEPTCTEPGKTAGTHCPVCGKALSGGETIPATGHSYDDGVITKAATCTEDGEMTYTCSSRGDDSYTEVISATGHTPGEAVRENEVAAQVGVEGSYDEVVYCSVCEFELSRNHATISALQPDTPVFPVVPDDDSGADATTIEDQAVPLAGLMPVAQLLEELRQYEKIEDVELPEDFQWLDHEYAQAIYWALQKELVVDTEEDPLDPDEVITVGLMREILINYVEICKGLDDSVVTLEGEDDELVMDLGERLTAFYGELEAALKAQEDKAA